MSTSSTESRHREHIEVHLAQRDLPVQRRFERALNLAAKRFGFENGAISPIARISADRPQQHPLHPATRSRNAR